MALSLGGRINYLDASPSPASLPNPAAWEYWKRRASSN
jgi:hypothetical protein